MTKCRIRRGSLWNSITSSTITSGTPRRYASSRLIKIAGTLDFVAPTPPSHQVWMGREVADVRFSSPAARHFSFDDLSACAPRPPPSLRMRQDCGSHRRPAAAVEHPIGRGISNPRPPRAAAVAIHCAQYKTRQTDNIVQVWTSNAGGADLPVVFFAACRSQPVPSATSSVETRYLGLDPRHPAFHADPAMSVWLPRPGLSVVIGFILASAFPAIVMTRADARLHGFGPLLRLHLRHRWYRRDHAGYLRTSTSIP
jgi:hypothetical protein